MIPFGILAGYFYIGKKKTEFRLMDLSVDSFTFRLPEPFRTEDRETKTPGPEILGKECNGPGLPDRFELHFYHQRENRYHQVTLLPDQYTLLPENEEAENEEAENEEAEDKTASFWQKYRMTVESEAFSTETGHLIKEYLNYIDLKLAGNDAELSRQLIGYPAAGERIFAQNWEQQKKIMLENLNPDPAWTQIFREIPEYGILLDRQELYETYLQLDEEAFLKWYYRKNHLEGHPVRSRRPEIIAVGNQFCPHLLPESRTLAGLLEKIQDQGKKAVVLLPPLAQNNQAKILEEILKAIPKNGKMIEIAVNDLGTLKLLHDTQKKWSAENPSVTMLLTAGSLLNKRRRDVRLKYKMPPAGPEKNFRNPAENAWAPGENARNPGENAWNLADYSRYMRKQYGLTGRLEDSCGYPVSLKEHIVSDIPPDILPEKASDSGSVTLLAPFYQMNTAGHCTLYAACHNGSRGRQSAVSCCPHYCRDYVFLYPEMLNMVGIYNSLFGFDEKILADSNTLQNYQEQGLKRLLLQLL